MDKNLLYCYSSIAYIHIHTYIHQYEGYEAKGSEQHFIKVCELHHSAQLIATWNLHLEQWIFSHWCFLLLPPDVFFSWWWEKLAPGWQICWFPGNSLIKVKGDPSVCGCSHLNTVNKHSPPLSQDVIYEVSRFVEIVRQRKTVEVHARNAQELDAVGSIETLLGIHQTPTFQIALSGVEHCSDSQILENPGRKVLALSLREGSSVLTPYRGRCSRPRGKCQGRPGQLRWLATSTSPSRPCTGRSCLSAWRSDGVGPCGRLASPPRPPQPPPRSLYPSLSAASSVYWPSLPLRQRKPSYCKHRPSLPQVWQWPLASPQQFEMSESFDTQDTIIRQTYF